MVIYITILLNTMYHWSPFFNTETYVKRKATHIIMAKKNSNSTNPILETIEPYSVTKTWICVFV